MRKKISRLFIQNTRSRSSFNTSGAAFEGSYNNTD